MAKRTTHTIALAFADERSIVQTRFATTVLALLRASCGDDLASVADQGELALTEELPVDPTRFSQFVFLGADWTTGLANEAALKLREVAGAWAESYPAMEYRHGPIAALREREPGLGTDRFRCSLRSKLTRAGATIIQASLDPMAELIRIQRLAIAKARA